MTHLLCNTLQESGGELQSGTNLGSWLTLSLQDTLGG